MILIAPAPETPFRARRTAEPPGVSPLDPAEWTVVQADFAAQMAERERLIRDCPGTVLAALPEAEAACAEFLGALLTHLASRQDYVVGTALHRPDGARVPLGAGDGLARMALAGRLGAEDWCLMLPDAAGGEYRLGAAVLCFPSRWSLAEKIGRPLTAIHDPVPDYDERLAARVNRIFAGIRAGHPVKRANWLIHATPELHLPKIESEKAEAEAVGPATRFYLRTERQTLWRLPATGAVVFGIKTSITPIERLDAHDRHALATALRRLDPRTVAYRAGADLMTAVLARLDTEG